MKDEGSRTLKRLTSILAALGTLTLTLVPLFAGTASAAEPGNQYFNRTWERTDLPVEQLLVSRTWLWGNGANSDLMTEEYLESPGGSRTVQYFDKSRMEITNPAGDSNSIWYVTNGLLVVELITGQMQIGDNLFEPRSPANVPVAGDLDDAEGPTYATFGALLDAPATDTGDVYVDRVSRSGQITSDQSLLSQNIVAAYYDDVTGHTVAEPFWAFMNSSGLIYENGQFYDALMFESPVFATGRPITEAYWANVLIAGTPTDVLMQCFERRCLTYNPSNPEGWQVEAGNVGIHYYEWRYGDGQNPPAGDPPPGDPPPGDPPPGDPPPGDPPPPGNPPPGNPPPNAPDSPANVNAITWGVPGEDDFDPPVGGILIEWNDRSNDEDGFKIYRYRSGGDAEHIGTASEGSESFFDPRPDHDGRWCYFVVSYRDDVYSGPSDYDCAYAPRAPQLVSPEDGYTSLDRVVTFQWNPVEDAKSYSFCLFYPNYPDAECGGSVLIGSGDEWFIDRGDSSGLEVSVGDHLVPSDIFTSMEWTVAACFGGRSGIYCVEQEDRRDIHYHVVNLVPEIISPVDGYVSYNGIVPFEWTTVSGARGYLICFFETNDVNNFCDTEHDSPTFWIWTSGATAASGRYDAEISPTWAPEGEVRSYYWTIAACFEDQPDCIPAREQRLLTIDLREEIEPPVLDRSEVDPNDPGRFTFYWNLSEGAERYILCVAEPGANCQFETGAWYKSSILGPTVDVQSMDIPLWLAPDGQVTNLNWTVAACDAELNCVWQPNDLPIVVDRTPPPPNFGPPTLVSATVDPGDPGRFTFEWNLVQGAERYIVCVAEPGANCANETGAWYKSSVLGETVNTYPIDIPLWLAPDGQVTNLNWTAAACDAALTCVWQGNHQPIVVDRTPPPPEFDPPALTDAIVDEIDPGAVRL